MRLITWPAIAGADANAHFSIAWQLEQTQWWSRDRIEAHQRAQLAVLVEHARASVAHYRGIPDELDQIPIIDRHMLANSKEFLSTQYPIEHGKPQTVATSRTTGTALVVQATGVTAAMWRAITLRDHAWHRRDLDTHLASIRFMVGAPKGTLAGWGPATDAIAPRATSSQISVGARTEDQIAWLVRENPHYLLSYPTVLDAIVRRLDQPLPRLRQIRTVGEMLAPATRVLVRDKLGVEIVDAYSSQEVGYIGLQCPESGQFHIQSEALIVEVLDDKNRPVAPGGVGRVVVTSLHNFASPIIRYDLGDYAEVGTPCPCGRGLPTLRKVVGRRRNMLVYPDGRTAWPLFSVACRDAARYRELQLVQETVETLRVRVVPDGDFTNDDRRALVAALHGSLHHRFAVEFDVVDTLERSPGGKLDEFVSRVAVDAHHIAV